MEYTLTESNALSLLCHYDAAEDICEESIVRLYADLLNELSSIIFSIHDVAGTKLEADMNYLRETYTANLLHKHIARMEYFIEAEMIVKESVSLCKELLKQDRTDSRPQH